YPSEIVFIVAVGMAFTMALISSSIGLSIAIGPFLIGLIVSVSLYNERIKAKVVPVKELFMAVFFISIGLQIDPRLIVDNILLVLAIAGVFILGKTVAVALSTYLFGFKARDGFVIATSLIAMGEFAFIIAKIALDAGLLTQDIYSSVIGAALITMVVLPLFAKVQKRTFDGVVHLLPRRALAALARIDTVKQAASSNNLLGRDRNVLSGLLARIFVDYLLIILILLIFNLVSGVENAVIGLAGDLGLVPDAVLLFFMLLAISPAVASIFLYVRKISKVLTDRAMLTGRIAEGDRRNVYRMIIDMNEIAMFILVLVLIIPFVPPVLIGSPWVVLAVVAMAGLAAILLWDALRNSYVHFVNAVTGGNRMEQEKDGP
ncbi:MAG TPA: cation:proton antiporter, partial [Methanomassiliicoccales archaeon]|nr:cation:proton antiporter [Methanomassiliicoccales archaeon]